MSFRYSVYILGYLSNYYIYFPLVVILVVVASIQVPAAAALSARPLSLDDLSPPLVHVFPPTVGLHSRHLAPPTRLRHASVLTFAHSTAPLSVPSTP